MVVAVRSPIGMGCSTATPAFKDTTPVMTGKREPAIWGETKTSARAVEWLSQGRCPACLRCVSEYEITDEREIQILTR